MLRLWTNCPRGPLLCSLVLLLSVGACTVQGNAVRVIRPPGVASDEMQITKGDNISLRCEGPGRLIWSFPTLGDDPDPPEVKEEELEGGRVASTLRRFAGVAQHTGYYNCSLEHNRSIHDSFYVYVADPKDPWVVPNGFTYAHASERGSAILDCRTNNRSLDVSLTINSAEVSGGVFLPRLGMRVGPPLTSVFGTEQLACEARPRGLPADATPPLASKDVLLLVLRPTVLSHPKVGALDGQPHALEGKSTTLRCNLTADSGTTFEMRWVGPSGSHAESEGRWNISEPKAKDTTENGRSVRQGWSELTIRDLEEDDAGNYTCIVSNPHSTRNSSYHLEVFNETVDYIIFDPQPREASHQTVQSGSNVTWVVYVKAFPEPTFSWFGPLSDVTPIANENTDSTEYKSSVVKEGVWWKTVLQVLEVDLKKRGYYYLNVWTKKDHQAFKLTLTVLGPPQTWLKQLPMLHRENEDLTAVCHAKGSPLPNVTWRWRPCPNSLNDCPTTDEPLLLNVSSLEEEMKTDVERTSKVTFRVNISGIVVCSAHSTQGEADDLKPLQLTDLPGMEPLAVWGGGGDAGKDVVAVEGHTVDLWCGALKENYTDARGLEWRRCSNTSNCATIEDTRATMQQENTTWSARLRLRLNNVSIPDAGQYACIVQYPEGATDSDGQRKILLHVKEPVRPFFRNSNLNETEWHVQSDQKQSLICDADGVPPPNITWYRNGKPLKPDGKNKLKLEGNTLNINFLKEDDEGIWRCVAKNSEGREEKWIRITLKDVKKLGFGAGFIALIIILVFVAIASIPVGYYLFRYHKIKKSLEVAGLSTFMDGAPGVLNPELPADEQAELLPYDKKWEFPRDRLQLGKQLGAGAFGVVLKAQARGIVEGEEITTVAVKMVKRTADFTYLKALASELKIMVHLGRHLNVVNLLGACTGQLHRHELLVIVEYCRFGNLHNYLLRHRDGFVDQIDSRTGRVDSTIGMDRLERTSTSTSSVGRGGRIKYASLSFSGSSDGNTSGGSDVGAVGPAPGPQRPVDYREAAAVAAAAAAAAAAADADNSDACGVDSEGAETICMSPTGGEEVGLTSSGSAQPHWRSNYGGDYGSVRIGPICTRDLLCWAYQVARGMQYLASRKVMHGDLAARNILLAEGNVIKICDFGLAKSMYKSDNYKKKGDGPLPVKWMALESIRDRVFSTQSDVWSFGVVLWELFSLGATPYPGMVADERLYNKLLDGYRMEQPTFAPNALYSTMLRCWAARPVCRPSFDELAETLGDFLDDSVKKHYLDLNNAYMHMNEQWQREGATDYLGMLGAPDYGNLVAGQDDGYINGDTASGLGSPRVPLSPAPSLPPEGADGSGYLPMRGGSSMFEHGPGLASAPATPLSDVFSPRPNDQVFTFAGPRAPTTASPATSVPPSPAVAGPGAVHNPGYSALPMQPMHPTPPARHSPPSQPPQPSPQPQQPSSQPQQPSSQPQQPSSQPQQPSSQPQQPSSQPQQPSSQPQQPKHADQTQQPPALTSGPDNYVNMPQQKRPMANGQTTSPDKQVEAFSNPSYINASALPLV